MSKITRQNFTQSFLDNLPPAEEGKRYMVYDATVPKLAVRVTDKGNKSFLVQKFLNNRAVKTTFGQYPEMTIAQARKKAMDALAQFSDNVNPNDEKKKFRQEATLGELFEEFMERYSKKQKKSWKYDEREIPRFLTPWFNRKISDVTKQQVQKLHEKIRDENGLYQANRLLERLKSMYNRAIEWGWDGVNPCNGIKKFKEVKRDRFIKPAEFKPFFEALEEEENLSAKNYIWISLLTGARKSNVLAMRWDEIDFEGKIWRIPETKNGEPLNVPIVEQALQLLKVIRQDNKTEWVFPSQAKNKKNPEISHLKDPKRAWDRILTKAGIKNLRIHDIRRTLGSYQTIMGASLTVVGKSLGHKSSKSTEVYAQLTLDPVRDSMQTATDKILEYSGERWDIYDINCNKLGKTVRRDIDKLKEGEYHLSVDVWIVNSQNKFLIQKRASSKKMYPNMWESSAGGAVIAGETSYQGCIREVIEEFGIIPNMENATMVHTFIRHNNTIIKVWLIKQKIDIKDIKIQEEEVAEVKYVDLEEIHRLLDNGEYVPTVIEGLNKCISILGLDPSNCKKRINL